jgi:hypothetical protein
MRNFLMVLLMLVATSVPAHEGDHHGPVTSNRGLFGGVMASVVAAKDVAHIHGNHDYHTNQHTRSKVLYKSEWVSNAQRVARLYLYDNHMKPIQPEALGFAKQARAYLEASHQGKVIRLPFVLNLKKKAYIGQIPPTLHKPFHIEALLKIYGKVLITKIHNLD